MLVTVYNSELKKKTVLNEIVNYRYKRWFYNIGDFEMTVLETDPGEPYKVIPGDILYVYDEENGDDSLYVTAVSVEKGYIKISGQDLKIILNWRITLFPTKELEAGTYGYDVRQGYTSSIIKGYIDYNLCEASDPYRRIDNCYCSSEGDIGLPDDSYMSRLQPLNEVVEALCRNAGIGYKVTFDTFSESIIINILEGKDKISQGGFGTYIGNADGVKRIRDNSSEYTVAWAVNGTGVNDATVTAVNLDDGVSSGLLRKETVTTVNCETDFVKQSTKHAVGSYKETEEIDASINAEGMYYDVGDVVSVYDDLNGYYEMKIIAIEKDYSHSKMRKKLHFVDYQAPQPRVKTLNKIASSTSTNKKDAIDQKLDGGGSSGSGVDGLVIENAVIIKEDDSKYLLHKYTEIKYISGNKIGYAGPGNQIIVGGYTLIKDGTPVDPSGSAMYVETVFPKGGNSPDAMVEPHGIIMIPGNAYPNYTFVGWWDNISSGMLRGENTYDLSRSGINVYWQTIYPPDANHPFGYVEVKVSFMYVNSSGELAESSYSTKYADFASEAEYNAAMGLTYEPNELIDIRETITEV